MLEGRGKGIGWKRDIEEDMVVESLKEQQRWAPGHRERISAESGFEAVEMILGVKG